ncbi:MAG: sugar ABC transporter permease [Myxococcales bacterium]|nr:sugar ABC transporter permease [Myxococcales bacterium]
MSSTLEHDPRVIQDRPGIGGMIREYGRRIRQGDIGQLPVAIGLIVIGVIFQVASNGTFLKPFNLVNLTLQMASGGMISVGIVLVLLLGEIDLSAGVVSGMCAAVMAVVTVRLGLPGPAGLALGLLAGMAVGTFHGIWITRFGIPSFVVTLAGVIGWQGLQLRVLDKTGTINLQDKFITDLATTFFSGPTAYIIAALFIAYVGLAPLLSHRRRRAAGLTVQPLAVVVFKAAAIGVLVLAAVAVLDRDRGISSGLLYLVIAVIVMDFVLNRMRFGRMVYAIGGNAEAARRAGIPVQRIRVVVFLLTSAFAAWGGILGASRLYAVNQSAGQGPVLLNAIAAAVIGGTSLFGGRGSVWAALTGTMVIQSISNGMDLLSLSSSLKFMITAGVLLSTVTIDAVLRRSKSATAR